MSTTKVPVTFFINGTDLVPPLFAGEDIEHEMAEFVRGFYPDRDAAGRGDDEVLVNFARDHQNLGHFTAPKVMWIIAPSQPPSEGVTFAEVTR